MTHTVVPGPTPAATAAVPSDDHNPSAWPDPCDLPGTVRFVSPQGRRLTETEQLVRDIPAGVRSAAGAVTSAELFEMYRQMVLTREFDREATSLQRQGELGLWPQCLGQEAAQIGSAAALQGRDHVFPSYREHGVALARGIQPVQLTRLFRAIDHGGWDPATHGFHLYTLVIGSHALHATGYAMGIQRDGDVGTGVTERDRAVIAYFGDGATAQGDVNEALVFAASTQAPIVFFVQNNQWAISAPTSVQSVVPLAERGSGFGIPSFRVDGNDALAVAAVTAEALAHARAGKGPVFIEAVTYRMGAHTTSDDVTRYRERAEEDAWRRRDPIDRLATLLRSEGVLDDAREESVRAEAAALAADLRVAVRALTPPPASAMFDHVYATWHPRVAEESAWYEQYAASFEPEPAR